MLDDLAAAYAQALAAVADAFVEAFLAALGLIDLSDPAAVKAAEPGMRSLVVKHRRLAAQAANAFLDASAAEHGVEAYHPPVEPYHASALRKLLRENVGASAEQLAAAARRHVVMAGHRQMMRAVLDPEFGNYATRAEQEELERSTSPLTAGDESDDDAPAGGGKVRPVGWARVLQGRWSCGFCIMLAGRGAVYSTADAAKYVAAPVGEKSREGGFLSRKARTELRKKNPRAFHENCDCIVVPVFDPENWSGRAEQQRLAKFYRETVEKEDRKYEADPKGYEPVKISTVLSREAEAWQEAERLDGKREQVDPKYYGALASEIPDGERLYGHELLFLLRFEALGNKARWIERPALIPGVGRKPSNDFVWLNNGELISELKSSKDRYSTIKTRISQAVSKAREQGVVKENFVVDLGKYRMGATLKQQIQSYNLRNPQNRIKNLYVMHGNGEYLDHIMFD
nr:MAG TPA: minor capsid protein [Caudoviricetes sp.]